MDCRGIGEMIDLSLNSAAAAGVQRPLRMEVGRDHMELTTPSLRLRVGCESPYLQVVSESR